MTRPDRPSDEEICLWLLEQDSDSATWLDARLIRAALAKWGQPAAQVEASEEEMRNLAREVRTANFRAEHRVYGALEQDVMLIQAALARFAPPAPYDPAKVEALIEHLLKVLPDARHADDSSWDWCWNELSGEAQDAVWDARRAANETLAALRAKKEPA